MKKFVFSAVLACTSCGASLATAQLAELSSESAAALSLSIPPGSEAPAPPVSDGIPDPFTLGGEVSPSDVIQEAQQPNLPPEVAPASELGDPASLQVDTNGKSTAVVDALANYSTLAGVQHAGQVPVHWDYGLGHTPNPVAEYLLREDCVDGLWDGYAEQRAHECAAQWAHIHGGCLLRQGLQGGTCQQCGGGKNRYLHRRSCDACDR